MIFLTTTTASDIHSPAVNSSLPDDGHPVLEAVDAVGNLGEVVLAHRLLLAIERAVVSAGA